MSKKYLKKTCEHKNWELRDLHRYDKSYFPPKIVTLTHKFCTECGEDLGEFSKRLGFIFKGKGTNDRRFVKGITNTPYGD